GPSAARRGRRSLPGHDPGASPRTRRAPAHLGGDPRGPARWPGARWCRGRGAARARPRGLPPAGPAPRAARRAPARPAARPRAPAGPRLLGWLRAAARRTGGAVLRGGDGVELGDPESAVDLAVFSAVPISPEVALGLVRSVVPNAEVFSAPQPDEGIAPYTIA